MFRSNRGLLIDFRMMLTSIFFPFTFSFLNRFFRNGNYLASGFFEPVEWRPRTRGARFHRTHSTSIYSLRKVVEHPRDVPRRGGTTTVLPCELHIAQTLPDDSAHNFNK